MVGAVMGTTMGTTHGTPILILVNKIWITDRYDLYIVELYRPAVKVRMPWAFKSAGLATLRTGEKVRAAVYLYVRGRVREAPLRMAQAAARDLIIDVEWDNTLEVTWEAEAVDSRGCRHRATRMERRLVNPLRHYTSFTVKCYVDAYEIEWRGLKMKRVISTCPDVETRFEGLLTDCDPPFLRPPPTAYH